MPDSNVVIGLPNEEVISNPDILVIPTEMITFVEEEDGSIHPDYLWMSDDQTMAIMPILLNADQSIYGANASVQQWMPLMEDSQFVQQLDSLNSMPLSDIVIEVDEPLEPI